MADKQPLKATFFAFRKRERGGVLLRLSLAFVIVALVLIGIFLALSWSALGPIIEWYVGIVSAAATNDTAAVEAAGPPPPQLLTFIGVVMLWMFPFYLLCAAYEAGCLRWMIHGENVGFMGLSLGAQTWRIWSVYWLWFLLYIGFSIVMSFVMMMLVGVLAVSSGGDETAMLTALPVFYALQYGLMIYFGIRFAPAAATTIARRRFSFFDAWTVTKGRFWALFGSFFVLVLLYALASVVFSAVWLGVIAGYAGVDLSSVGSDPHTWLAAFSEMMGAYLRLLAQPQSWILIGLLQVVSMTIVALLYVAMYGVNARAAVAAMEEGKIQPAT